ncbi:streptophobe family protein [Streptomyces sp. BI20]|uniref:streptophobe family protein n=1 Tax=Streptomyces sp. BI20 TaxID=3403460 RepID=UPI003C719190
MRWGSFSAGALLAVGTAAAAMAGVAALGLWLLGVTDTGGSLGAMTAATVIAAAGGRIRPTGELSVFGMPGGAGAEGSLELVPLGVSVVGAVVLGAVFLRTARCARGRGAELAARAGVVASLWAGVAAASGAWGREVVTLDGARLPSPAVPRPSVSVPGVDVPGLEVPGWDLPDLGGLLPDRVGDLIEAKARVGFAVEVPATVLGALGWVLVVLVVALAVSRHGPVGWARWRAPVRGLLVLAAVPVGLVWVGGVVAGLWRGVFGAAVGALLLGAPNGGWTGWAAAWGVPWEGSVRGDASRWLPEPVARWFVGRSVSVGDVAGWEGWWVWLPTVGSVVLAVLVGVVVGRGSPGVRVPGAVARSVVVTAAGLGVVAWATRFSLDASLGVLGVDLTGLGARLAVDPVRAVSWGAVWGAGIGVVAGLVGRGRGGAAGGPGPAAGGGGGEGEGAWGPYRPPVPPGGAGPVVNPYRSGPSGSGPGPGADPDGRTRAAGRAPFVPPPPPGPPPPPSFPPPRPPGSGVG